ncbi:substrate-binding domain-containing protein, partial [Georgenia sp. 10Sc9-8]|nr:substrate-binding domain-containing protein [Georgenia halotolerans]
EDEARRVARALLRAEGRPTAVLVSDEVLAEQVWREATAMGLDLPADLSLASFADAPWMSMVVPGVTAVPQAEARLGEIAVDMLQQRIDDPTAPVRTTVRPAQVVFRGSTAPPA